MTSIKNSHDSSVSSGSSAAIDSGGTEIPNNNNPSIPHSSSPPFPSVPYPSDKSKDERRFPDKHLPIRSLSCHELGSADKPDGLPEKYLTGMIDIIICVVCSCGV